MSGPPGASDELGPEDVLRLRVKAELRKRLRGVRRTTPLEACQERSRAIIARLESIELVAKAKRIALYWPIEERHEVDLRGLDASLRARGVRVAYPAIDPETGDMTLRFADDPSELEERSHGLREPAAGAPEATELDVVVVPALAVDPTGHRIGYGAGYYDRTLPKYAPPALSMAVVYDWQLVAEVPFTKQDVRCAMVVTDARVLDARG